MAKLTVRFGNQVGVLDTSKAGEKASWIPVEFPKATKEEVRAAK